RQRLKSALGRMRKSQKLLIEHTVEIHEKQTLPPCRRFWRSQEVCTKIIHRVHEEISRVLASRVALLGLLTQRHTVERVFHYSCSVKDLVQKNALIYCSIAALGLVCADQSVFRFLRKSEFEDRRCQVIGWIDDVQFAASEIVVLEVCFIHSRCRVNPFVGTHP